jgi:hypothetical protein
VLVGNLANVTLAAFQHLHLALIDVESENGESLACKSRRQWQADVAKPDDADPRLPGCDSGNQRFSEIEIVHGGSLGRLVDCRREPEGTANEFWLNSGA